MGKFWWNWRVARSLVPAECHETKTRKDWRSHTLQLLPPRLCGATTHLWINLRPKVLPTITTALLKPRFTEARTASPSVTSKGFSVAFAGPRAKSGTCSVQHMSPTFSTGTAPFDSTSYHSMSKIQRQALVKHKPPTIIK